MAKWYTIDRFYEKYFDYSPYCYTYANPIKFIDINGDSVWTFNGREQILYEKGVYYRKDGTVFDGEKTDDFKEVSAAIDELATTEQGQYLLDKLSESNNNFVIRKGISNNFQERSSGGGTIKISGKKFPVTLPCIGGLITTPVSVVLGHELAHAFDFEYGMLDRNKLDGVKRCEYQAVYRENIIRSEMKIPLREYYQQTIVGDKNVGSGPRMLDKNNNNKIPSWYKENLQKLNLK